MKIYSVTEVLGKYVDFSKIPDQILAAACTRGTKVHKLCALYAQGAYLGRVPDELIGYIESFVKWYDANVIECLEIEKRLTSEALGFTGQFDFLVKLKSCESALVDIKTAAAAGKTWKCQLAAYDYLCTAEFGHSPDALISLRPKVNGGPAAGIRYEGDRVCHFNVFLSALNAHRNLMDGI